MHVISRPIDAPVALIEHLTTDEHGTQCALRVLVFNTGVVAEPVLRALRRLLARI